MQMAKLEQALEKLAPLHRYSCPVCLGLAPQPDARGRQCLAEAKFEGFEAGVAREFGRWNLPEADPERIEEVLADMYEAARRLRDEGGFRPSWPLRTARAALALIEARRSVEADELLRLPAVAARGKGAPGG